MKSLVLFVCLMASSMLAQVSGGGLPASPFKATATVTWDGGAPETGGFIIERMSPASPTTFVEVGRTAPGTTIYVETLTVPGTYSYHIRAYGPSGVTEPSNTAVGVAQPLSGVPTGTKVVVVVVGT